MPDVVGRTRTIRASWGAWTGEFREFCIPPEWECIELAMRDAPGLGLADVESALSRPIGAQPLEVIAAGRTTAAIAIDDITRPTRPSALLERILDRLSAAGVAPQRTTIIVATGAHRNATQDDIRLKVGTLIDRVRVVSHDASSDLVMTGAELAGQPVRLNREFMEADLRIAVGCVMPHPFAGFSGGGKIVLPGLSDLNAVVRSHKYALLGPRGYALEGNRFRIDMERTVGQIGLDWSVNVVLNSRCEIATVAAGNLVDAHRVAAAQARAIGATSAPAVPLDALVVNAYPKDSELLQAEAALVPLRAGMVEWLRPLAPIVLVASCPHGLGAHQLFGPGGLLFKQPGPKSYLGDHTLHIVSPAVAEDSNRSAFWDGYPYHPSWDSCLATLSPALGRSVVIGYAANGPLHVPLPPADSTAAAKTEAGEAEQ